MATAVAPDSDGKLARTLRARRDIIARVRSRAEQVREPARPLVWFHAPSVGEGLQARPVIAALRAAQPDTQVAYTFFSPSAEKFAESVGADIVDYLPFDTAANAHAMLDALQPSAIVFAKLDVWPVLVEVAASRNIPCLLISGTVAPGSGRLGRVSRAFVHDAYASLHRVGAIDEANADRLAVLGVPRHRIRITGDTRFDQVVQRAHEVDRRSPPLSTLTSDRPTLVAGSTWPADESVLLPAFADVWRRAPAHRPRIIIAPHEPTPSHVSPIERWASQSELSWARIDAADVRADVVIVDRVGLLGQLYALADVAFVGGGFHAAGLHSVIEPAAFAVPVLFGPRHDMSREAGLLIRAGGATVVSDPTSAGDRLLQLLLDPNARRLAGQSARGLVDQERGAVGRTLDLLVHG